MFVILEDRTSIAEAIVGCFEREGIAAIAVASPDFEDWFENLDETESTAVEAILLGVAENRRTVPAFVHARCHAPVIAVQDGKALGETLELFSSGVNDVVTKPFHIREILARVSAIKRRGVEFADCIEVNGISIFFDGRDPQINGVPLQLPRRERRILEYLILSRNLRVTKTQIFNRVYGVFNDQIHENVVESHISRLRKRLKQRLGFDPIDSQRYLGYRFMCRDELSSVEAEMLDPSLTQGPDVSLATGTMSGEEIVDGALRRNDHQRFRDVCAS